LKARVSYSAPGLSAAQIRSAATAAAHSNVAIVFVGTIEGEGTDRSTLGLPPAQDTLVTAVARANPHTVVVVNSGGPVLMPWLRRVAAVFEAWYPGQEEGTALAALLYGDVNFSGHLPITFPRSTGATPVSTVAQWPGVNGVATYSEGLQVGYRWYLHHGVTPLFPFGWGLGYSPFRFAGLHVAPTSDGGAQVRVTVSNTGVRAGIATPQVYVRLPASAAEPSRRLAAFARVWLAPGHSRQVSLTLPPSAFTYWDAGAHQWTSAAGTSTVFVATSAATPALSATLYRS
jgi:beta-glucosidase